MAFEHHENSLIGRYREIQVRHIAGITDMQPLRIVIGPNNSVELHGYRGSTRIMHFGMNVEGARELIEKIELTISDIEAAEIETI